MNILAIGAHFDDVELGCGGSLLKWQKENHKVSIFVATKSGYRDAQGKVVRSDVEARREGMKAAKSMGAKLYEGNFSTFDIEFNERLNRKLLEVLRATKPDLVLTHWMNDIHHDHRVLAQATLHCCRHVPRVLMYRSNWYHGNRHFESRFSVDISRYLKAKIKLVETHRTEYSRTKGKWATFIECTAVMAGLISGCAYAETFEVVRWFEA